MCCKYLPEIGFNEHHLIGLILVRDDANAGFSDTDPESADDIESLPDAFSLRAEAAFAELPTTMFMDTIDALQCSWVKVLYGAAASDEAWGATEVFVRMLFRRAGVLVGSMDVDDAVFNHVASTEVQTGGRIGMTQTAVRQLLDVFVVFFRHFDLYRRYEEVALTPDMVSAVKQLRVDTFKPHALEATRDHFYNVCTYFDLPTGARLAYMHRFSGMYNCVSQVAFFHNESYERRLAPKTMQDIKLGIEELPLLVHMYPEVPVVFEDERPKSCGAYWMLLSGRIYLVRADGVPLYDPLASNMFAARESAQELTSSSSVAPAVAISL